MSLKPVMNLGGNVPRRIGLALALIAAFAQCNRDPLARLQSNHRAIEARLTGFDYTALHVVRGQRTSAPADQTVRNELKAKVLEQRTPQNLHRFALAELAGGDALRACALLEEVARLRPRDAAILSDLAAAETAVGEVFDAAEHSAQALELDPTAAAAAFNWALALESVYNRPAAIEAWQKYLVLDPGSGWSDEARRHLARLREPRSSWDHDRGLLNPRTDTATIRRITALYPQRLRMWVQNELLPTWVDSNSTQELTFIRALSEARAAGGDPYLRDLTEHTAAHRTEVAPGFQTFAPAQKADQKIASAVAAVGYAAAAELLGRTKSPLALEAAIRAASTDSYENRNKEALKRLNDVDAQLAAMGNCYPSLAAESAWMRGLVLALTGDPQGSLQGYRKAIAEAKRAGETETEVAVAQLLATQIEIVGSREEADRSRRDVLRRCDEINPAPRRLYTAVTESAFCELHAGRPRLALAFVDWQMRLAREDKNPLLLAESESYRAIALFELGRVPDAAAAVSAGRAQAKLVESGLGGKPLADLEFTTGRIERQRGNVDAATAAFSAAIRIWAKNEWHIHVAGAYLARGETALAAGDRGAAERDFKAGVAEMEAQRNHSEPNMRIAYFERADRLFERLIEILVDDRRTNEALSFAEQKRARFLLDQIAADQESSAGTLSADEIAAASRGRAAILELALADRGASIWLIHDGQVSNARSTASRAAIEQAATQQLAAIAANDIATMRRLGRWLYEELVGPVTRDLPADGNLVIVPDGGLQAFPFATLVMPDGRYLIDAYTLATTPSATVFLRGSTPSVPNPSIVAVAEPAPRGFDRLPNAAREAHAIARLYHGGRTLIGSEITPTVFLTEAAKSSYVHFAGHAAIDLRHSSQSALLFEKTDGEAAPLSAQTIGAARLRTRPLVVLAACSTGRGKVLRNEGIDSLASAFLQAGARGVVATLWDVGDDDSATLFRRFHEHLRRGVRAAEALRETQRSLIHGNDPVGRSPKVWGSAVVIGTL